MAGSPARRNRGLPLVSENRRSALGELEAAPRLALAILLALDHAGVTGEKAARLQHRPQFRFVIGQGTTDAMAHRTGLAGKPAADHCAEYVVLIQAVDRGKRLVDQHAQHWPREIDLPIAAIDGDAAGAGFHPDTRDRILAAARGVSAPLSIELR